MTALKVKLPGLWTLLNKPGHFYNKLPLCVCQKSLCSTFSTLPSFPSPPSPMHHSVSHDFVSFRNENRNHPHLLLSSTGFTHPFSFLLLTGSCKESSCHQVQDFLKTAGSSPTSFTGSLWSVSACYPLWLILFNVHYTLIFPIRTVHNSSSNIS